MKWDNYFKPLPQPSPILAGFAFPICCFVEFRGFPLLRLGRASALAEKLLNIAAQTSSDDCLAQFTGNLQQCVQVVDRDQGCREHFFSGN